MSSSGGGLTRLTNDPANDNTPSWSFDGRHLVFTSDRDIPADSDLYIMRADGSGVIRLTQSPGGDDFLARWYAP